jgi:hypothetical protein
VTDTKIAEPSGTPYHIGQQYAAGLLPPLLRELRALEDRAATYLEHLRLTADDRESLHRAHATLRQAAEQLGELTAGTVAESTELPRSNAGSPRPPAAGQSGPRQ